MSRAFEILGIEEKEFDNIISKRDAFISITKCLFMCLDSEDEGLRNIAGELLQYIAVIKSDEIRMDYDTTPDSWITLENGEHVPLDEGGYAIGGAGGWANGRNFGNAKRNTKPKMTAPPRSDAMTKTLNKVIRQTSNLKKEQYRIIDKEGNVLIQKQGKKGEVSASYGEKREYLHGNISVHNHPEGGTFSSDDFDEFGFGATEICVAAPEGTYILTNMKVGQKDQYDGWIPLRDAVREQLDVDRSFTSIRKAAEERLKDCDELKDIRKITQQWQELRDGGASLEEQREFFNNSEYNALSESYKKKLHEEERKVVTEPYHEFYKKNAAKYGFKYEFIPKGQKVSRVDGVFFANELNHVKNEEYDVEYTGK